MGPTVIPRIPPSPRSLHASAAPAGPVSATSTAGSPAGGGPADTATSGGCAHAARSAAAARSLLGLDTRRILPDPPPQSKPMSRPSNVARKVESYPARTPTLPPATHTNSYALGGRDVVLVEPATPFESEQRAWIEWARGLASSGRRPLALFATHHHDDHVGGLEVLSRELQLPVWMHRETWAR